MPPALPAPPRVRTLSVHADYACAHSGACCRAGWTIPLEREQHAALAARLASGQLPLPPDATTPFVAYDPDDPSRLAFAHDAAGACAFLAGDGTSLCRIHRDAGELLLPVACQQFPRVAVTGDGWADVTLSHFCPTAARRLVDAVASLTIVCGPPSCQGRVLEGLDTRGHLPPLLRPGVLHTPDSWRRLEAAAVMALDAKGPVRGRLTTLDAWTRQIETWSARAGPLDEFVTRVVSTRDVADARRPPSATAHDARDLPADQVLEDWRRAWQAVPPARALMPHRHPCATDVQAARAGLAPLDASVGRYLAAKVFASWVPWLATRTSTLSRVVTCAYHVLVVEAARIGGPIGRDVLVEAIRQADLLLVHLVELPWLVRDLEGESPRA